MNEAFRKQREHVAAARFDLDRPIIASLTLSQSARFRSELRSPYDARLASAVSATAKALLNRTNANIAAVSHNGKIMLVWDAGRAVDFKQHSLVTLLCGLATATLLREVLTNADEDFNALANHMPFYYGSAYQVDGHDDVCNSLKAREYKNWGASAQKVAERHYSSDKVADLSPLQCIEMIDRAGDSFSTYPIFFQRGCYLRKDPEKGPVRIVMPPLVHIENLRDVIFRAAAPIASSRS